MTPEQKSRQLIDRQLEQAGWIVQDYRQFSLTTGFADYMLYVDCKAIAVVEGKPVGFGLAGVAEQTARYSGGVPKTIPSWETPLPFAYESTGTECRFTNRKDPDARSRPVFTFQPVVAEGSRKQL
ncbi:MAG: hypothetical protein ACKO3T_04795 [Planctomycetaceae bacterium]